MTINKLASQICKLEGKKSQARIGEVREILAILSDLVWAEGGADVCGVLAINGLKRSKKKPKAKGKKNATRK